jgi:hypothetical protein
MELAEIIGLIILVAAVLMIALIVVRRGLIIRAGGFDVSWRLRRRDDDRGWLLGQARYRGGRLGLYRSLSPLPARPSYWTARRSTWAWFARPSGRSRIFCLRAR